MERMRKENEESFCGGQSFVLLFFMCDYVSMKEGLIVYLGILIKKIDNHEIEQCVLITKILDL